MFGSKASKPTSGHFPDCGRGEKKEEATSGSSDESFFNKRDSSVNSMDILPKDSPLKAKDRIKKPAISQPILRASAPKRAESPKLYSPPSVRRHRKTRRATKEHASQVNVHPDAMVDAVKLLYLLAAVHEKLFTYDPETKVNLFNK